MSSPNSLKALSFRALLTTLKKRFPDIKFSESYEFKWDSRSKVIFFTTEADHPTWLLLHEIGHLVAEHEKYSLDIELLKMEVEAWGFAKKIGADYGIEIDQDYIEDYVDSYRDWLHKRSTCPTCYQTGIEYQVGTYRCINCAEEWRVGANRFYRVYRKTSKQEIRN